MLQQGNLMQFHRLLGHQRVPRNSVNDPLRPPAKLEDALDDARVNDIEGVCVIIQLVERVDLYASRETGNRRRNQF